LATQHLTPGGLRFYLPSSATHNQPVLLSPDCLTKSYAVAAALDSGRWCISHR